MKKQSLFAAWGILYSICAGLGFIPDAQGGVRYFLMAVSALFFVPPIWLMIEAVRTGDRACLKTMAALSALSLGLTLVLLVVNILSAFWPDGLGLFLHALLTLVSVPMMSSTYWAVSLFLWACLLIGCLRALAKK